LAQHSFDQAVASPPFERKRILEGYSDLVAQSVSQHASRPVQSRFHRLWTDSEDKRGLLRARLLDVTHYRCAMCHVPPLFTEPGWNLHKADEIGIDDFQAKRGPDDRYVTAKLRALWDTKKIHKGGFYHDGRFATLTDVVNHYDNHFQTMLSRRKRI
jgi:hypothetical protein